MKTTAQFQLPGNSATLDKLNKVEQLQSSLMARKCFFSVTLSSALPSRLLKLPDILYGTAVLK